MYTPPETKLVNEMTAPARQAHDNEALFQEALALQQQNQGEAAIRIYDSILLNDPEHAPSLHMIGIFLAQSGRYRKAKKFLSLARKLAPANPDIQTTYATLLGQMGDTEAAIEILQEVISRFSDHATAFYQLGLLCNKISASEAAVDYLSHAIAIDDHHAEAYLACAQALLQLDQSELALQCCEQAATIAHSYAADAAYWRGRILESQNTIEAAAAAYLQAIDLDPGHLAAARQLSVVLDRLGQTAAAADHRKKNLNPAKQHHVACITLAKKMLDEQENESALEYLDDAISSQATVQHTHILRAKTLIRLERPADALTAIEQASTLGSDSFMLRIEQAAAMRALHRFADSLQLLERAEQLGPDSFVTLFEKAKTFHNLHQFDTALTLLNQALVKKPDLADLLFYKSLLLLLKGDLLAGFPLYEQRWQTKEMANKRPRISQPQWNGEQSLIGKTILLHSEQGLGDTLQFCRYLHLLQPLAGRIIFATCKELQPLLKQLDHLAEIATLDQMPDEFDFHCPLLSLPLAFGTRLESIPSWPAYLQADADKMAEWAYLLGPKTRPRIGLVWRGNPAHQNDVRRSLPLDQLLAALPPDYDYIALHKEPPIADRHILTESALPIRCVREYLHDFSDTAALCSQLDLIISVDTSVAHLAGALGRPTLLLLPHTPDWRWLLERKDSPWYPSLHLLRQNEAGEWSGALSKLPQRMAALLADAA